MKSFRHGMQTASEASSQELTLNPTPDESASETSSSAPVREHPPLDKTRSAPLPGTTPVVVATGPAADHTVRKKRSRMVVPLAVLEEFSEGSSSREIWSTDDLSDPLSRDRRSSSSSQSSDVSNNAEDDASSQVERTSPRRNARSKRNTFKRTRSKQASMNGPVMTAAAAAAVAPNESCIVDLNSNAKDSNSLHNESPSRTYEELERMVLNDDEDARDDEDTAEAGDNALDEFAMLRFAEKYFNVHVIHLGYPNTITKTVNIITRKSLNVSGQHLDNVGL